jgi:hypothetical protein
MYKAGSKRTTRAAFAAAAGFFRPASFGNSNGFRSSGAGRRFYFSGLMFASLARPAAVRGKGKPPALGRSGSWSDSFSESFQSAPSL